MGKPTRATDVEAVPISFLWGERIPKGMISLVAGQPDKGKGLFAAMLAAEISRRGQTVLYSAPEDDPGQMTKPRLEAAGADLSNIILWDDWKLPRNWEEWKALIIDEEVDLVIMDPLAEHLSDGIKRHSENIRKVLGPIKTLIGQTGTSVVIIDHTLKRPNKNDTPLGVIGGNSSGAPSFSRAAYVLGQDPEDADRRILAWAKFNIGPKPKPLAFEIDVEDIEAVGDVPLLMFDEELEAFDTMRMFDPKEFKDNKIGRPPEKRAAASEWLTLYLADAGPTKAEAVREDAIQSGMTHSTLRRASSDMGIVKTPKGGGKNCTWDLPDDVKEAMGLEVTPGEDEKPAEPEATEATATEAEGEISLEDGLNALLSDAAGGEATDGEEA